MSIVDKAKTILREWKGDGYIFGLDILDSIGTIAASYGKTTMIVSIDMFKGINKKVQKILREAGVAVVGNGIVPSARPNAPREDVYRIETYILHFKPDSIIVIGGGSAIDAVKAANALSVLGTESPDIESYFGTGLVTAAVNRTGKKLLPVIAVQTSASSGAHLTKYSNITDPLVGQKKLIVDDAVIPTNPVFDYSVTSSMPLSLTIDGALDGIAHCLEVFYGATEENYEKTAELAETAIELVVKYTSQVVADPENLEGREAIGLATDLGGYAIMVGGTNGAHLTSFSLVDVTSHGRACGIMNPYYTVFFAPAIEEKLRIVGAIYAKYGYITKDLNALSGRELGEVVAEGMLDFNKAIGSPTRLGELPGFTAAHIERALEAAKNPQLKMKLQNMPVALTADEVDVYMRPILEAAQIGDLSLIKNL
ncbi:MAG: iron-containing alcohol dehydrogenase [Spirochaetales bacterium]|nr:iron-containing alcohol dehydrogenase [Spirochaetales bacterium]